MSIRRSLLFSFLEKYASTFINIGATLWIARLLTPAEIGIFSVGAAVVGILHAVRDFGITNYLIQARTVSQATLRTAFTVTFGLSWLFAGALFFSSGWAAEFYDEEGVRQIIWIMAANFLLIPFGSPILALMRREMQFGRLAYIQLTSTAVNQGTALLLAWADYGFMSLAWASLTGVITTSGLAFLSRPHAFFLRPSLREWRDVLTFGSYASGSALIADLRQTAPDLIVGRLLGFEAVGLLSRAMGLLAIFNKLVIEGLQPILLPALSEKVRRGENLRAVYLQAMEYVTALHWPFLAFVAFMADPIITVLFGDQWLEAAPLVQILCIAYVFSFPAFMTQPLLMSLGRMREVFVLNVLLSPITLVVYLLGSMHSLEMVAIVSIPMSVANLVIMLKFLSRFVEVSIREILYATLKSAAVTALAALAPAALTLWDSWAAFGPLLSVLLAGGAFSLAWLIAILIVRHPLRSEILLLKERLPLSALRH